MWDYEVRIPPPIRWRLPHLEVGAEPIHQQDQPRREANQAEGGAGDALLLVHHQRLRVLPGAGGQQPGILREGAPRRAAKHSSERDD